MAQQNIWAALQCYFGYKTGRAITDVQRSIHNNVALQYRNAADTADINVLNLDGSNVTQLPNGASIPTGKTLVLTDANSLLLPGNNYTVVGTATLAQINAGLTLVAGATGRILTCFDFWLQMNGTFTTATDIRLSDTTPTLDIVTIPIASAVTATNVTPAGGGITNNTTTVKAVTVGAGFATALASGVGIQIRQTGSAAGGGTSVLYKVEYGVTLG